MTRVADDKKVSPTALAEFAVQQWELFRRVKEGTLDATLMKQGLEMLTFGEQMAGLKFHTDLGGIRITLPRQAICNLAQLMKGDGSRVKRMSFSELEWIEARESGRNIFQRNGLRVATLPEVVAYIAKQKPPTKSIRWGLVSWQPQPDVMHWNVSFEEYEGLVTVLVAQLNWEYLSHWKFHNDCPVLGVSL